MNLLSNNNTPGINIRASERAPRRRRYGSVIAAAVAAGSVALGACGGTADDSDESEQQAQEPLACGSSELTAVVHNACAPMDAVAEPDEHGSCLCLLGFAWNGSECVGLGDCQCVGSDCNKLTMTQEECEAAHADCGPPSGSGQSVACGSAQLYTVVHDECAPMDAAGAPDEHGSCLCLLGFAWNGSECVGLGDCQCVGEDCNKLTETLEECEAAHAACG